MQRISTPTKAEDLFGPGKHGFRDGDPLTGTPPTTLSAAFFNSLQEEVANAVEGLLGPLVDGDRTQLKQAILAAAAGRVAKSGDTMTGGLGTPTLTVKALPGSNAPIYFRDEAALGQAIIYWNRSIDALCLSVYGADGTTVANTINIGANGRIEVNNGPTTDNSLATKLYVDGRTIPAGAVQYFAGQTAPSGWLAANGAAVSRTTYASLFAAIGTTFGAGDGATTFNLPDLRGEFLRGFDAARGVDSGRVLGSAQTDELKSHTHAVQRGESVSNNNQYMVTGANNPGYGTTTTTATGGTETRPRNIALLACIKY